MRLWPWVEGVRASGIAHAILTPGMEEVGVALRELLGVATDATLTPSDVGNALKLMRDLEHEGKVLRRTLDRKGIALWRMTILDPDPTSRGLAGDAEDDNT
jgi:hypothetical protein